MPHNGQAALQQGARAGSWLGALIQRLQPALLSQHRAFFFPLLSGH